MPKKIINAYLKHYFSLVIPFDCLEWDFFIFLKIPSLSKVFSFLLQPFAFFLQPFAFFCNRLQKKVAFETLCIYSSVTLMG